MAYGGRLGSFFSQLSECSALAGPCLQGQYCVMLVSVLLNYGVLCDLSRETKLLCASLNSSLKGLGLDDNTSFMT